jgi:protein TonB
MFESSLIALEEKKRPRRWAALPVAIALHAVVLVSIGLAQAWQVAKVAEPPIVSPYHVLLLPPPPPPAPAGGAQRPATVPVPRPEPQTPRQPDTREIPELPDTPEPMPGPVATDGPAVPGASEFGVPGGQEDGVPGGDPNSPGGGGIGLGELPAAPQPPQDEILRVTGAVKRPVPLSAQPPRYTELARRAGIQGAVIIEAVIDEQGRVVNARILKGLPMGLDQEALATVRGWTFQPATLGDRPVKVFYSLTVHFQIQR